MEIHFSNSCLRNWLSCCILCLALFCTANLYAEGSKELAANGGNRAYLLSSTVENPSYPFPTLGTMKVYVKEGETIYVGSSAQGQSFGTISLRSPDGATYTSGNSKTVGFIGTRAQEVAGPQPNAGGYLAFTRTVLAGQGGIWEIDFISPNNGGDTGGNPPQLAVDAQWVQPTNRYIAAFDVSVRNAGNTAFLTGRVFTNVLSGILGTFDVGFNAILNILTKDGYHYTLDNNGQAGNGFTFFANNKGFRNADGTPSYKSVNNTSSPDVYNPANGDTPSDITHKIFFNTPAADLPASANTPGGNTWLVNVPVLPTLSNISFIGADGISGQTSTANPGGKIKFTATANGSYTISIDINRNGVFTDGIDRIISGTINAGSNEVVWNGLDGAGSVVPANAASYTVNINVSLFAAEVHFPFFDVERNLNGIKLTRTNGANSPDNTIYWDDSPITPNGLPSNPVTNTTGLSSLTNGHKWGKTALSSNDDDDFGNNKSIDTWAYVITSALAASLDVIVKAPNPDGIIFVPNIITPNNDGKNDVFEVKGIAGFPGSRLMIFNRWGNQVYKSENYANTWDANGLADGTYYYLLELNTGEPKRTVYKGWLYINRR